MIAFGIEWVFLDQFQGLLNVSLILRRVNSMDKPNGRLVLVSYMHYCTSTSSLSTRWSSWALLIPYGLGDLILRSASRLYAFSGYHNRTSLPSRALGRTTGTQEVRPSRSSRTKDSPPANLLRPQQIGTELSRDVLNPAHVPL